MKPLDLSFYLHEDVIFLGKMLLGKHLFTYIEGEITSGKIVETESYRGAEDKACHAYKNRKTSRTSVMFENGGVAYIYLCYGLHHLLNVVTNKKDVPHAILIRAIEPILGVEVMLKRQNRERLDYSITSGPGSLTKSLGITLAHNGSRLDGPAIWIEQGEDIVDEDIMASPRVGVAYAKEDALLPWRFRIRGNCWTSPAK